MDSINPTLFRDALLAALREDIGSGDVTSQATVASGARATAQYIAKQSLVVSGVRVAHEIARLVDEELEFNILTGDASNVAAGTALAEVHGAARSILIVERTSLNLLQRMCGIA